MQNRIKEQGSRLSWGAKPPPGSGREPDLFAHRTSAATCGRTSCGSPPFAYVLLDALRRHRPTSHPVHHATGATIRLKLLEIGAQVRKNVRRIKVAMASACPYQAEYHLAYSTCTAPPPSE
jgi:hypothetical protein